MPRSEVGLRIERRLKEMDRDQRWLAGVLGKSPSSVSRWMDGTRRMSVDELRLLAAALHRSPGWLLGEDELAEVTA